MRADPLPTPDEWNQVAEDFRNKAWLRLADSAAILGDGVVVTSNVMEGDAAETIITEADRRPGTLIAMATHGRSGIGRWLLGSITDKVVRHAKRPTLVVRAHKEPAPSTALWKRIILPLDGSRTAEAAIPHAVEVAKALDIGISMLQATSLLPYATSVSDESPGVFNQLVEQRQAAAREYLGRVVERIRAEGVRDVPEATSVGDAGAAILDELSAAVDQLVVMATHGRSGVGRWVLGSVTNRVVRHSPGALLVVPPDESRS